MENSKQSDWPQYTLFEDLDGLNRQDAMMPAVREEQSKGAATGLDMEENESNESQPNENCDVNDVQLMDIWNDIGVSKNSPELETTIQEAQETVLVEEHQEEVSAMNCEPPKDDSHLLSELERREIERNKEDDTLGKNAKKTCKRQLSSDAGIADEDAPDEQDFIWEDYLEETSSIAAPPSSFTHVEKSLENGFKESLMIEVLHDSDEKLFWFATITMTCGPLISLRYLGNEQDKSKDFWCDINTQEVHPVGWCEQHNLKIQPPQQIIEENKDWATELLLKAKSAETPPTSVFTNGMTPIDQIKPEFKLEVQDECQPTDVWFATIMENVGGRLLLRYEGCDDASQDFWLFYLSHRLHPIGWAKQQQGCQYVPPKCVKNTDTTADTIIDSATAANHCIPPQVVTPSHDMPKHNMKKGLKVEMLSPIDRLHIVPATICDIIDQYYFIVELDCFVDDEPSQKYCRHALSWDVFYPFWAKQNGLKVQLPKGWNASSKITRTLDWTEYLKETESEPALPSFFPQDVESGTEFSKGLRLEAVNPFEPRQLCAASITKVVEHLMWIQLDSVDAFNVHHITSSRSHDIFPVGWCQSNNYPLRPPRRWYSKRQRKLMASKTSDSDPNESAVGLGSPIIDTKSNTVKVYLNHLCFSGKFLSKGKMSELPQSIGPGPVKFVLKQAISLLISIAYIPTRVLRELTIKDRPQANMDQVVLKAKYKNKSMKSVVEICQRADQVGNFCKMICRKLQCCPLMFGVVHVKDLCPRGCYNETKTKFSSSGVLCKRARKVGRPIKVIGKTESLPVAVASDDSDSGTSHYSDGISNKLIKSNEKSASTTGLLPKKMQKVPESRLSQKSADILDKATDMALSKIIDVPTLSSNPVNWSITQLAEFLKQTNCADLVPILVDQQIDGNSILLLNMVSVRQLFQLKIGPAIKLCKQIERLKAAFLIHFS